MLITKEDAIRQTQELWEEIATSGLSKTEFFYTTEGLRWGQRGFNSNCPLCEYAHGTGCAICPLPGRGRERCFTLGYSPGKTLPKWLETVRALTPPKSHKGKVCITIDFDKGVIEDITYTASSLDS